VKLVEPVETNGLRQAQAASTSEYRDDTNNSDKFLLRSNVSLKVKVALGGRFPVLLEKGFIHLFF
jgi:hypothetical protein